MWRNYTPLICMLLLCTSLAYSQNNYNNHWFFGSGHSVSFDNNIMQNTSNALTKQGGYLAANSGSTGNRLFHLDISGNTNRNNVSRPVFKDANNNVMPNGEVLYYLFDLKTCYPLVIPHPADSQQYIVITTFEMGLQYSIVDMRLNNGLGDVVANAKLKTMMPHSTILTYKITTVRGCDAIWLIARSAIVKGFVSFKIDHNGVHNTPVYSYTGNWDQLDYQEIKPAIYRIKASPDGTMLAEGSTKGLELYDIERCSGKVKNPRIIDTTMSFGTCFSPDNKLLYTTRAEYQTGYYQSSELVQWDVSQPQDVQRIRNSEQLLLINSAFYWPDWICPCSSYMGDIAQGKDGKLYILANTEYDDSLSQMPTPLPPTTTTPWAQTMHIIHQPNTPGVACNTERDGYILDGYYRDRGGYFLPHPTYSIPNEINDTIYSAMQYASTCFGNGATLAIDTNASCIVWYNGASTPSVSVSNSGKYWVQYNKDCQVHIDSFEVKNTEMPEVASYILACPNEGILDILPHPLQQEPYTYTLQHTTQSDKRTGTTLAPIQWPALLPGTYSLRIQASYCDTTIMITVDTMPRPNISISPQAHTLKYGEGISLEANGAWLYSWYPTISLDTAMGAKVWARPKESTRYEVIGINEYGCRDTAYAQINVDHSMELWLPNAFTPNNDGLNDVFRIEGVSYQRLTEWSIYNRYGQQVFFTTDINASWDGTYRGQPCDAGVYYYLLQYIRTDNKLDQQKGEVHLLR